MKWKDKLINDFENVFHEINSDFKEIYIKKLKGGQTSVHLAILNEPFLSLVFSGKKTVESRFSINKVPPFQKVQENDIVILKKSGGGICGSFIVKEVLFFRNLQPPKIEAIEKEYGEEIGWHIDPTFLSTKSAARFLTLIRFDKVINFPPFETWKKDRTGWTIIKNGFQNTLFQNSQN